MKARALYWTCVFSLFILCPLLGILHASPRPIVIMMTDMQLLGYRETYPSAVEPYLRAMAEKSGVPVTFHIFPHAEYPNRIKLALASGNLPDVYNTYGLYDVNFPEAIRSGIAIPLDNYLLKYGRNLLRRIPPYVWEAVKVNGKIYAIPEILLPSPTRRGVFIRADWLKRVGANTPVTVEDYLQVLRLFRDKDPNGNGAKDEIPYIGRENLTWMECFFGAYGVLPNGWHYINGRFVPDIVRKEFIQALGTVRQLYLEGLLDQEFPVNTGAMWEAKILSGKVGMWEHIGSRLPMWQREIEKRNPGAKVIVIPAPLGPKGHRGTGKYAPYLRVWFVTRAAKDPAAVVRFFDWLITEEGQRLVKYGLPGITYHLKAGEKIDWDPAQDPDHAWRSILLAMVNDGKMDWEYELRKDPVNGPRMREVYEILAKEGIDNPGYDFEVPKTLLDRPELKPPTGVFFLEHILRIILGKEPLSSYEDFIREWLRRGGESAIAEATIWYKNKYK
ncbi:MAG: extracellular solute-binding protein [Firmicutes bacterium]|nr:extracellular solute-binding protein [Bacillota bacterium]